MFSESLIAARLVIEGFKDHQPQDLQGFLLPNQSFPELVSFAGGMPLANSLKTATNSDGSGELCGVTIGVSGLSMPRRLQTAFICDLEF